MSKRSVRKSRHLSSTLQVSFAEKVVAGKMRKELSDSIPNDPEYSHPEHIDHVHNENCNH